MDDDLEDRDKGHTVVGSNISRREMIDSFIPS
jgi:hypothetical protein